MRWRAVGYWLATILVVAELGVGGTWDIARIPYVRGLGAHWAIRPTSWCCWEAGGAGRTRSAGAASRVAQRWAYAGTFFTYTGAIVSHLATGYDLGEVGC